MDLRLNIPPQIPILQQRLASALEAVQQRGNIPDLLGYGPTAGSQRDREAGAEWLRPVLPGVAPDDILICAGGAPLLVALTTTFAKPGDTIATEALTYPGIRAVSRHFGMTLSGVAMDEEGIVPAALDEACGKCPSKILYCTPTIQNPTTAVMSQQRREEIVAVARRHDLMIFEDDAYAMLPSGNHVPLAVLAPERTFYMASLSKCISPGLRIAYCVAPESMRGQLLEGIRVMTILTSKLLLAVATQWIEDGAAIEIRDAIRAECSARQQVAKEFLSGESFQSQPASPHLWLSLNGEWDIPELGRRLREGGMAAKGDGFAVDNLHPNALRIALGASRTREDLVQGLELLKFTLHGGPKPI